MSFAASGSAFGGGIRKSSSLLTTRLMSSLIAALPGTAAFAFSRSSRVSNEIAPLYVPFVWHLAQRALRIGTTSCAKSVFRSGGWAGLGST